MEKTPRSKKTTIMRTGWKTWRKKKQDLKKNIIEEEKIHIEKTALAEHDHKRSEEFTVAQQDIQLSDMEKNYEAKLAKMKE